MLASIGPNIGAVMGWVERERRRGLAMLRDGARVAPVTLAYDSSRQREEARAEEIAATIRRAEFGR